MKPTNPMAQLQQWKANHQQAAINRFVNEMNRATTNKSDKNCETDRQFEKLQNVNLLSTQKTQQEAQGATKTKGSGNYHSTPYARNTRKLAANLS